MYFVASSRESDSKSLRLCYRTEESKSHRRRRIDRPPLPFIYFLSLSPPSIKKTRSIGLRDARSIILAAPLLTLRDCGTKGGARRCWRHIVASCEIAGLRASVFAKRSAHFLSKNKVTTSSTLLHHESSTRRLDSYRYSPPHSRLHGRHPGTIPPACVSPPCLHYQGRAHPCLGPNPPR